MQSRLPTIVGKAVEDAIRTINGQAEEEEVVDLPQSIERIAEVTTQSEFFASLSFR